MAQERGGGLQRLSTEELERWTGTPTTTNSSGSESEPEPCPLCRGTGFLLLGGQVAFGGQGVVGCDCSLPTREERLGRCGVPLAEAVKCSLDTLDPARLQNGPDVIEVAQAFTAGRAPAILVLMGGFGVGKTHLALAVFGELLDGGYRGRWERWVDALGWLRQGFDEGDWGYHDRLAVLKSHPVLVLDDIGAEKATEWAQERLYDIVDFRHANNMPTVVTLNISLSQLGNERVASRLKDRRRSTVLVLKGKDQRPKLSSEPWGIPDRRR